VVIVKYSLVTNPRWRKPETEMVQKRQFISTGVCGSYGITSITTPIIQSEIHKQCAHVRAFIHMHKMLCTFPDSSEATPSPSGGTKASNIEPKSQYTDIIIDIVHAV